MENLMGILGGLFNGGSSAGGLIDLLSKKPMGNAASRMSGPVAGAVLPQSSLNQALTGSPTSTNPMMSPVEWAASAPPSMGSGGGGKKWEKWATPQDTSAGMVAGQPNDPMYGQMMQQAMQGQQNQQQPQKQTMTPLSMPGAIQPVNNPNDDIMSLFKRLLGGM